MRLLLFLTWALLAFPAWADDTVCGGKIGPEDLVGNYTLEIGNAIMTGGGRIVPMKVQNTSQVAIYLVGTNLIMGEPPYSVDLELAGENEPDWNWNTNKNMAAVSSDDFALVVGCDMAELPRVIGTGQSNSTEGTPIVFTYRLIVWGLADSGAHMFGALEWTGGGINQKRIVFLTP